MHKMHKIGHFAVLGALFMGIMGIATNPVYAATGKNKHEIDKDLAGLFAKFDKNHDKFLDKPEVTQVATAAFTLRDVNKDGIIEKTERKSWLSKKITDDNGGKDGKLPRKEYMT
ncbi:MAG: hypothetical protein ORN98_11080, partial [Alphaproteobacteria bacterium]|nr:hypothetical protein [Alphaproteobacteria bacterium]